MGCAVNEDGTVCGGGQERWQEGLQSSSVQALVPNKVLSAEASENASWALGFTEVVTGGETCS